MLFAEVAATSEAVAATRARLAKIEAIAACLRRLEPGEVAVAVPFLAGELRQRQIGVGWAALRELPGPAAEPSLTVLGVDAGLAAIGATAGPGSVAARRALLTELFAAATAPEQAFLRGLLSGELRQGALDGVMADAVARAAEVPAGEVRRAAMLGGYLGQVAEAALGGGVEALRAVRLEVGRPLRPMLAQTATDLAAALERLAPAGSGTEVAVEAKLDGIRVQAHLAGGQVRVFTRTLDDVSARLPEIAEAVAALPAGALVLDGEVIALRPDGRPQPFQLTASRTGSRLDVDRLRVEAPLSLFAFDLLHLDGADLVDLPGAERAAALAGLVPAGQLMPRTVTGDPAEAEAFLRETLAKGHEGVMVKSLAAPYEAGRRGAGWLKVKPRHTLDLVVLAVEWGHGRRTGRLSNLHLGARDPAGGFVMLGKTFKGMTDEMLAWQTEHLLTLETAREGHVVRVRPELVVEVAFDGVQASPRYPGGLALRFARVLRYRPDKTAAEADTIDTVRALHAGA